MVNALCPEPDWPVRGHGDDGGSLNRTGCTGGLVARQDGGIGCQVPDDALSALATAENDPGYLTSSDFS